MEQNKLRVLFSSNSAWSIFNFRKKLLTEISSELNADIFVLCPFDKTYTPLLSKRGFTVIDLTPETYGLNALSQLRLFFKYIALYKSISPDVILHNAVGPNIFGTIAASLLKVPNLNNVSGLGSAFIHGGLRWSVIVKLYKYSHNKASHIFFQNPYDLAYFKENVFTSFSAYSLLPGSGVDIKRFHPMNMDLHSDVKNVKFCFIGRLIGDKGIYEYIRAAEICKNKAEFHVLGELPKSQITAICKSTLDDAVSKGVIHYHLPTDHMEIAIGRFDVVVLPSYREGMARILLEAASTGLPVIASNVPGCNSAVIEGVSGYLCEPRNVDSLVEAICKMVQLTREERLDMGKKGRELIVEKFDERLVIERYIKTIKDVIC